MALCLAKNSPKKVWTMLHASVVASSTFFFAKSDSSSFIFPIISLTAPSQIPPINETEDFLFFFPIQETVLAALSVTAPFFQPI